MLEQAYRISDSLPFPFPTVVSSGNSNSYHIKQFKHLPCETILAFTIEDRQGTFRLSIFIANIDENVENRSKYRRSERRVFGYVCP